VLEVAIGTGRNLPWYPRDVELVGVDVSPNMLDAAQLLAEKLARPVDLSVGDAQQLDFPDASFDTVVATLTLCSIPDERLAVQEMARVLRPGGRLILLDHVASPIRPVRAVQRLLDPLLVRFEGDHLLREPDVAVCDQGLVIDELSHSKWGIVSRLAAHNPQPARTDASARGFV
jgi:ubiquinone/menaquinone biosynthesis C-methylase UbiE